MEDNSGTNMVFSANTEKRESHGNCLTISGGALLNFLKKRGQDQATRHLVKMCLDAAAGMNYLESKNCIHR